MTDFWTTILDFAQTTTARVGTQLLKDFGKVQASQKSDGSLVTQADRWADRLIQDAIASSFNGYGILSEEGEHIFPDTEWCWVIDPLDGTTNFTRGIPLWAISLGLLYQGTPVFGYVYLPPLAQAFHGFWSGTTGLTTRTVDYAGKPGFVSPSLPSGAFLNHQPIHTSADPPSSTHFFSLCTRSTSVIQKGFPCKFRMLGVASYNFLTVATGATLGGVESSPKIWDIAAAWAIVQAAGGVWVSLKSEPVFPLSVGQDYGDRSYPTLVVSRPELVPVFQPFVHSVVKK